MTKSRFVKLMGTVVAAALLFTALFAINGSAATEFFTLDSTNYVTGTENALYLNNLHYKLTAADEKDPVIAYFGGSITYGVGASAKDETSWRALTEKWFEETYPDCTFTFNDATIRGTGSRFAALRAYRDLNLGTNPPDLVFVEYAINDNHIREYGSDEAEIKENMRVVFNRIYEANPYAEIIVILTTDSNTFSSEEKFPQMVWHREVAAEYGIAAINVGAGLVDYAKSKNNGEFEYSTAADSEWAKYFDDYCHPNDGGYEVYAGLVIDYLGKALTAEGLSSDKADRTAHTLDTKFDINRTYANNSEIPGFSEFAAAEGFSANGELLNTEYENAAVAFRFYGKNADLWAKRHLNFGEADVYIDGVKQETQMSFFRESSYTQNVAIPISTTDLEEAYHTVTIVVKEGILGGFGAEFQAIAVYGDSRETGETADIEYVAVDRETLGIGEIVYERPIIDSTAADFFEYTAIDDMSVLATSESNAEHGTSMLADGAKDTYWEAAEAAPAIVQADLGAEKEIGGIKAWWKGDTSASFTYDIYVTNTPVLADGTTLTAEQMTAAVGTLTPIKSGVVGSGCGIEENGGYPDGTETLSIFNAKGRYIVIHVTECTATVPALWELDICTRQSISIAYKREIADYSSSQNITNGELMTPERLNDGDRETRWTASGDSYPQHVTIDLGAQFYINKVRVSFPTIYSTTNKRGYRFKVYYGTDAADEASFTLFDGGDFSDNALTTGVFEFETAGLGRYLKIELLGCTAATGWAAVGELEAYGYGVGSTAEEVNVDTRNKLILVSNTFAGTSDELRKKIQVYGHCIDAALNEDATSLAVTLDDGSTEDFRIIKGGGNIAYGKSVSATVESNPAANAVDGVSGTAADVAGWYVYASQGTETKLTIDLGGVYAVNSAKLYWFRGHSGNRAHYYKIYAGTTIDNLEVIADRSQNTAVGLVEDSFSEKVVARYFVVEALGTSEMTDETAAYPKAKLCEIELYGYGITSDVFDISAEDMTITVNGEYTPEEFLENITVEGLYGSASLNSVGEKVSGGDKLTIHGIDGSECTFRIIKITNIATGKIPLATRVEGTNVAANANDGDFTTYWGGFAKASDESVYYPTMFQVDLGAICEIHSFKAWLRNDTSKNMVYSLYITDEPLLKLGENIKTSATSGVLYDSEKALADLVSAYTPVSASVTAACAGRDSCSASKYTEFVPEQPINGRYVIMYFESGTAASPSIWDLEVNGVGPEIISQNKTVKAKNNQGGYLPEYVNDGDTATRWNGSSTAVPNWITIDLGGYYKLTNAKVVLPGGDRYYAYQIYGSIREHDDIASESVLLVDRTNNTTYTNGTTTIIDDITSTAPVRYVTLYITNIYKSSTGEAHATAFPGAYELEISGIPVEVTQAYGKIEVALIRTAGNKPYSDDDYDSRAIITLTDKNGEVFTYTENENAEGGTISFGDTLPVGAYRGYFRKNGYKATEFTLEIAADKSASAEISPYAGDIKQSYDEVCGDGVIDIDDFARFLRSYDRDAYDTYRKMCDIDEDGAVTVNDLSAIKLSLIYGR